LLIIGVLLIRRLVLCVRSNILGIRSRILWVGGRILSISGRVLRKRSRVVDWILSLISKLLRLELGRLLHKCKGIRLYKARYTSGRMVDQTLLR
jgi:hypothetical protein